MARTRQPMTFLVTVTPPPHATRGDMALHIIKAVQEWKGSLGLTQLDPDTVKVRVTPLPPEQEI